jgi:elongation factor Tu
MPVHSISGRGTVVTGLIEPGTFKVGEEVEIVGLGETRSSVVTTVEAYQKILEQGEAGDNVGWLLRGIDKDVVERGQVLTHPGSVKPHPEVRSRGLRLRTEQGGRRAPYALLGNYRPQFHLRTTDVTGTVELTDGLDMVMPGDNAELTVELDQPIAMEEGSRFAVREGNKTVGAGIVIRIVE